MKKLDSWEIFQEIDSPTYLEILARNINLEGYFGKVSYIKLNRTQNPMNPYKMGPEQRSFSLPKAHRKMLDKSRIRTEDLVCTLTNKAVFVHVLDIF